MAAPVIDQGVVIGVLVAQLSNEEIDNVVTGDRRWRQEGFGATGEAYLVGPDYLVRSGAAGVLRESRQLLRRAEGRRHLGRGDRRHPALRDAGAASAHRHPGHPGRARRRRGYRRDRRLPRRSDARLVGAACDSRRQVGPCRQDRHRRGLRADPPAAPGPDDRRRLGAAGGDRHRRLAFARAARAAARAHRRGEALCCRRLRGQRAGPHARRDRPALLGLQRHGRRSARKEHRDREQEPRERGAAAQRAAGADRQPAARRRAADRRRLRRGHGRLRRPGRLHRS